MSTSITKIGGGGEVTIKDSANLDAFSRLRISNPLTLFASQFTYNLNPLLFQQLNTGGGTPSVVIDGGYVAAGAGGRASVSNTFVASRYPITLDAAGNHRNLGTITLIAKSVSGTQNCRALIKFREIH